ncbi:MAG: O-antigen ligase family protein [Patescibacteria group bacterium]|nr:O-antigen ligase family protein [Patescibacteria group bacterium]
MKLTYTYFTIVDSVVFFLLCILPFAIMPFGISEFETPKVLLAEAGIIMLCIISLIGHKTSLVIRSPLYVAIIGVFLLSCITAIFFPSQLLIFGNAFRMQGLFVLWFLLVFSIVSRTSSLRSVPWFVFGILLGIQVVLTMFIATNESGRYVGTLGEPNALASFAIFIWPFAFFAVKKFGKFETIGMAIIFFFIGMLLFLTNSHSGLIALGIQLLFLMLQKFHIPRKKVVFICLLVYLASYMLPFFQHIPYENRTEVWKAALYSGTKKPLLGNGFGNGEVAMHTAAVSLGLPIQYYYVDSGHNIFFDWFVQGGLVGVGLLCVIIYQTFVKAIKEHDTRQVTLIFGMLTVLSFNPASIVGLLGFWWIIGQAL